MRRPLTRPEALLLLGGLSLLCVALVAPAAPLPASYHQFADSRTLWGIPHALNVLSNLPYAALGIAGLVTLRRRRACGPPVQRRIATLGFLGLVATALCSGFYHLAPDDMGLAVDRLGMSVAFAGLFGLVAAALAGERAGLWLTAAVLVVAPLAVRTALAGNLVPWSVLQAGGLFLLLVAAFRRPLPGAPPVRWGVVLGLYALAKGLELGDALVLEASGGWVSGHTLKHLVSGAAAWPVVAAFRARRAASAPALDAAPGATRA